MLNLQQMEFTWYLLASWAAISLYGAWRSRLALDVSLFVFLLMSIVESNLFTVLTMSLKWVDYKKETEAFINILLFRNVLRPVLYLFAAAAVVRLQSGRRWAVLAAVLAARMLLTWVSEGAGLMTLVKLNYAHVLLMDAALIAFACLAAVGFLRYTRPKGVAG